MKQYILIALAILAGRYVDMPVWFTILYVAAGLWGMKKLKKP